MTPASLADADVVASAPEEEGPFSPVGTMPIRVAVYEGPLDVLLELVKKHKHDIHDIPISVITGQYLAYIEELKEHSLDVASEFLVMAATLVYIKSRSLLPRADGEEIAPEDDPEIMRAELSRRLVEYRKFKEVASRLHDRPILGRDVMKRGFVSEEVPPGEAEPIELSLSDLVVAFRTVIAKMPPETFHQVAVDTLSIADAQSFLLERLAERGSIRFDELATEFPNRSEIIAFFLAILELVKERIVKVYQAARMGLITVVPAVSDGGGHEGENGTGPDEPGPSDDGPVA